MCSVDTNVGTISDAVHFKAIFSSVPDTGEHFIGNTLCSSELFFHATHSYFASPSTKTQEKKNSGTRSGE